VPGGVGFEAGVGGGAAAAALVEQQDVPAFGVELPAVIRAAAGAGPAVEKDRRLAVRISALFPVQAVAVADVEMAGPIGLDRRIEGAQGVQKLISS
jgi:hypothetical protein